MERQRTPAQRSCGGAGGAGGGGGAGDDEAAPLSSPRGLFEHAPQIMTAAQKETEVRRTGRRMAAPSIAPGAGPGKLATTCYGAGGANAAGTAPLNASRKATMFATTSGASARPSCAEAITWTASGSDATEPS